MTEHINNAFYSGVILDGKSNEKLSASPNAALRHPFVYWSNKNFLNYQ